MVVTWEAVLAGRGEVRRVGVGCFRPRLSFTCLYARSYRCAGVQRWIQAFDEHVGAAVCFPWDLEDDVRDIFVDICKYSYVLLEI